MGEGSAAGSAAAVEERVIHVHNHGNPEPRNGFAGWMGPSGYDPIGGRSVGGRLRLGVHARRSVVHPRGRPHLTTAPPRRRCPVAGARPVGRRTAAKGAGWRCPTPPHHRRAASGSSSAGRATATPEAGTSPRPRGSAQRQRRPESGRAPGTAEQGRPSSTSRSRQRETRTGPRPSCETGSGSQRSDRGVAPSSGRSSGARAGVKAASSTPRASRQHPPSLTPLTACRHSARPRPPTRRGCAFAPRGLSRWDASDRWSAALSRDEARPAAVLPDQRRASSCTRA